MRDNFEHFLTLQVNRPAGFIWHAACFNPWRPSGTRRQQAQHTPPSSTRIGGHVPSRAGLSDALHRLRTGLSKPGSAADRGSRAAADAVPRRVVVLAELDGSDGSAALEAHHHGADALGLA